jgi:hypothetical protein
MDDVRGLLILGFVVELWWRLKYGKNFVVMLMNLVGFELLP